MDMNYEFLHDWWIENKKNISFFLCFCFSFFFLGKLSLDSKICKIGTNSLVRFTIKNIYSDCESQYHSHIWFWWMMVCVTPWTCDNGGIVAIVFSHGKGSATGRGSLEPSEFTFSDLYYMWQVKTIVTWNRCMFFFQNTVLRCG